VTVPIDNILFDEKIAGSIHFTPGQSYRNCYNGNDAAVHWIWCRSSARGTQRRTSFPMAMLVRENGVFVHPGASRVEFRTVTKKFPVVLDRKGAFAL
jgi:aminopeptidase